MTKRGKKRRRVLLSVTAVTAVACFLFFLPFWRAAGENAVTPATVRVGMLQQAGEISFQISGKYQLVDQSNGVVISELKAGESWTARLEDGLIKVTGNGEQIGAFRGPLEVKESKYEVYVLSGSGAVGKKESGHGLVIQGAAQNVLMRSDLASYPVQTANGVQLIEPAAGGLNLIALRLNGSVRHLRGSLELRADGVGLTAINELSLEKYLCGVVPSEMPADWPVEALKAQAVAARCYVLRQMGNYSSSGFDVLASQYSQVYRGYDAETPATNRAVEETAGLVAVWQNEPINAFYHSSSGGWTENSEDVWLDKLPYIRAKEDPYDKNNKHYDWRVTLSRQQLLDRLTGPVPEPVPGAEFDTGSESGELNTWQEIKDLEVLAVTSTNQRVKKLRLVGLDGYDRPVEKVLANADQVRTFLGLKSALFEMEKKYDDENNLEQVTFTGNGWGHGLGMSQYGAAAMAGQGYTFRDILQYYYTNIEIKPNYGR